MKQLFLDFFRALRQLFCFHRYHDANLEVRTDELTDSFEFRNSCTKCGKSYVASVPCGVFNRMVELEMQQRASLRTEVAEEEQAVE